jgi:3-oxoadipate enol-lactonase
MVSGGQDFVHFRQVAAALADRIRGAEHLELDWAGHLPSLERPDLVGGLLLDRLAG